VSMLALLSLFTLEASTCPPLMQPALRLRP
jgi:hypothetical protein